MPCLSVCRHGFIKARGVHSSTFTVACAGVRCSWKGDVTEVGQAQPLTGLPLRAAASPRWGEGTGHAHRRRQAGGAVGSLAVDVPLSLSTSDSSVGGAWVWGQNARRTEFMIQESKITQWIYEFDHFTFFFSTNFDNVPWAGQCSRCSGMVEKRRGPLTPG